MTSKNAANATASIAFLTFIALGLTSGLLGVAWPSIQKDFNLSLDGVNVLIFGQTLVYSLVGFYIGRLMTRLGSGNALLAGAALLSLSMFGIAVSQTWLVVIAFALVFGLGSGIVDAGLNMYV